MKMEVTGFKGLFDDIGKVKEDLKTTPQSPLYQYLTEVANNIINDLKVSLANTPAGNNTILSQSIAPVITVDGDKVNIKIDANYYWKFINDGVNGLRVGKGSQYSFRTPFPNRQMAQSLERGISLKGLTLPVGFKDYKSYSYASAVKLKQEGIEPNHFVDNVLTPEYLDFISKELTEEYGKIVTLSFNDI